MQLIQRVSALFFVLILAACGGDQPKNNQSTGLTAAAGGVNIGGVFRYNEESYFRDLFPLDVTETIGHRITNNLYEGLLLLSQDNLKLIPGLATSYEVSEDGLEYTFTLRQGVKFHDDACFSDGKGREMTAADVKFSFDLLCSKVPKNEGFWVFKDKVLGANAHYEATGSGEAPAGGVEGIQVLDDYTVKIVLETPFPDFDRLLVTPFTFIFPKEAYEQYGAQGMRTKAVGTGPFRLTKVLENETVLMRKNPTYWGKDANGNQLPYLEAIRVSFIKEQKSVLLELVNGKLDMIYRLPLEMADDVMNENRDGLTEEYKQFQFQMMPTLSYQYYGFQHKTEPFKNPKLREAFCWAVDREKIVDFVMKGMATPAHNGIVPPAFNAITGYEYSKVDGFKYDPDKARKALADAGFPNGEGLQKITLQINSGGGRNGQIAEAIQKQLEETLNVEVDILQLQFPQHLETTETGKNHFWRAGWIADYTSPENFLRLYYGASVPDQLETKSYLNTVRYVDPAYDALFEKALITQDLSERQALYIQMEQLLIKNAVAMPLFFSNDVRLIAPQVRNFPQNAMEYRTFRDVYLEELAQ
ncbi:MAG: ABC transporter substrate-binding protein [Bacteroidota bacterium]